MRGVFVFLAIWYLLLSGAKADAEFTFIHKGNSDKIIVFIHGLWGDPKSSFAADGSPHSWPELIAQDKRAMRAGPPLSEYTVGTLGYPASRADTLSTLEIANRLLTDLYDNGVLDEYKQIFFVCHSLGGLVIKEIFRNMAIENTKGLENIAAIFLIATPSQGTPAVEFISSLPTIISGRLVIDIKTIDNNSYLSSLESQWQILLRNRKNKFPHVYCAYETKNTKLVNAVPRVYTATLCDETPRAENSDHINIVKPKSVEDSIYQWVSEVDPIVKTNLQSK